jgi:hypothetical protein
LVDDLLFGSPANGGHVKIDLNEERLVSETSTGRVQGRPRSADPRGMRIALLLLATLFVGVAGSASPAQHGFSVIALEGDTAPGTGSTYDAVTLPASVTDAGVAFTANLDGTTSWIDDVLYVDLGGGLEIAVEVGDPAPVPGTETFLSFGGPRLNDSGELVFTGQYTDPTSGYAFGIFQWKGGSITPVILGGDPVPGTPYFFDEAFQFDTNAAGDIVFEGRMKDASGTSAGGLFLISAGTLAPLIWEYDTPAPGGGYFTSLYSPTINDAGVIAFIGSRGGPGIDEAGIFRRVGGVIEPLLVETDVLPGTGGTPNAHLFTNQKTDMNQAGEVSFLTAIEGGTAAYGLFRVSPGSVVAVAWTDQAAPGTSGDLQTIYPHPVIADDGSIAFAASLQNGDHSYGLFLARGGPLEPVWLIGDPAPGGGVFSVPSQRSVSMSGGGHIAFWSRVFQGPFPAGLFRATPPPPPKVPALPAWWIAGLGLALAGWGRRSLGRFPH